MLPAQVVVTGGGGLYRRSGYIRSANGISDTATPESAMHVPHTTHDGVYVPRSSYIQPVIDAPRKAPGIQEHMTTPIAEARLSTPNHSAVTTE